jgi:hypothetical protein
MKSLLLNKHVLNESRLKTFIFLGLIVTLVLLSNYAFATDLLAGTDADIKDTMQGTGKHWMLWIDGGISLASFAYSKKPIVFFSVLGISLFITALVKMAGG